MMEKIEDRKKEKGTTEDEMVGWHHQLDGHEIKQAPGDGEGQGGLAYCSPWGFPGKNTGMGCHFLLQGIFPAQGLNLHLLSPALAARVSTTSST